MAKRGSNHSFNKRQKERKRKEKAERKQERRLLRKQQQPGGDTELTADAASEEFPEEAAAIEIASQTERAPSSNGDV